MALNSKIKTIIYFFFAGAVMYLLIYGSALLYVWSHSEYRIFKSINIGMHENIVLNKLGRPFKICDNNIAMDECKIEGYLYKNRPITDKVYVYKGNEFVAYYYINKIGLVEDVYVIGS